MFQTKLYTHVTLNVLTWPVIVFITSEGVLLQEVLFNLWISFFIYHLSDQHIGKPINSDPTSIGKILHQPHVHSYSFQADDCKCTKITCTYS